MQWTWAALGLIALALGMVGAVLPLLPTVPFLLLAAICFARSSERLHNWLITHPTFGPPIEDWNRAGAIKRRSKLLATLSVAAAFGLSLALGIRPLILVIQAVVLVAVLTFIWSRPER